MRENKLQIRIEARADQFQQAVNRMVAEAKAAGANVSQSLESAGKGADSLGKSVTGAAGSFDQIGRQGADALNEIGQEADQAGQEVRGSAQAMERALAALAVRAVKLAGYLRVALGTFDQRRLRKVEERLAAATSPGRGSR